MWEGVVARRSQKNFKSVFCRLLTLIFVVTCPKLGIGSGKSVHTTNSRSNNVFERRIKCLIAEWFWGRGIEKICIKRHSRADDGIIVESYDLIQSVRKSRVFQCRNMWLRLRHDSVSLEIDWGRLPQALELVPCRILQSDWFGKVSIVPCIGCTEARTRKRSATFWRLERVVAGNEYSCGQDSDKAESLHDLGRQLKSLDVEKCVKKWKVVCKQENFTDHWYRNCLR